MLLKWLATTFRIDTLVYEFQGQVERRWLDDPPGGGTWVSASDDSVRRLFREDASRCRRFLHFLRAGCFGYFLEQDGDWITYGWCAPPGGHPPHLPRWARGLGAYWIFYCHTRPEYRGQGHYKRLLARLVAGAHERAANPLVLCDTLPDNFASRRAVLQAGFIPVGVLTAYRPVARVFVGGGWRREQEHAPVINMERPRQASGAGRVLARSLNVSEEIPAQESRD